MRLPVASLCLLSVVACLMTPRAVQAADDNHNEGGAQAGANLINTQVDDQGDRQHVEEGRLPKQLNNPFFRRMIYRAYFWRLRYYFVAQNAANCDLFYGQIQDDPLIGRAAVDFVFADGCQCHGYALVTHYPHPWSVVGQKGVIKAKCKDGRVVHGDFVTTSLTTGKGTATDNRNNQYQFTFGQQAQQAVVEVNQLRKKLGCEQCSAEDIELKITGKVLPRPAKQP